MVGYAEVAQLPEGARPFTIREVADRWRMSVPTIHRMIKNGELSSFGPKGATRIHAAEVMRVEQCGSSNTGDTGTPSKVSMAAPADDLSEHKTKTSRDSDLRTLAAVGLARP